MDDPFSALKKALEPVCSLMPQRTYTEIRQLKEAADNYRPDEKSSFIELVKTLGETLRYFENRGIHVEPIFEPLKNLIDELAQQHDMAAVDWGIFLSKPKNSSRFQFQQPQHDGEFVPWLDAMSQQIPDQEDSSLHSKLIAHKERLGFTQRLISHLKKDPEFLSRLIMESKDNFTQISRTRLILYLTDVQLAQAIIKYLPHFLQENLNLNEILSNGRSISTILRNSDAKTILDNSESFQLYQNEADKNLKDNVQYMDEDYMKASFK
ncbi:Uncharacterised protein [Legionella wadsworthii]|uniref:Uncharacterized protein n=1 Tax=Legionella wadsworthii TaxID=28088 RepID=A0A378LMY4_9GAMM|nr:hypothetical protein [Legionella wadsworthii]STY28375.1 Uncharacterised protein [Legionella wadsworthii]